MVFEAWIQQDYYKKYHYYPRSKSSVTTKIRRQLHHGKKLPMDTDDSSEITNRIIHNKSVDNY